MLPSFEAAHCVNGHRQKQIASECHVTPTHFRRWANGHAHCPIHKRQSVDRAFGEKVDWLQYDREFDACNRTEIVTEATTGAQRDPKPVNPQQPQSKPPVAAPSAADAEFNDYFGIK